MAAQRHRPLIGVTTMSQLLDPWTSAAKAYLMDGVPRMYAVAVERAGGIPVLIPLIEDPSFLAGLVGRLDGLIVGGGHDVTPRCYNEEPLIGLKATDYPLDLVQIEAARQAVKRGLPILGICKGQQIINVAFGGTLYQDLAKQATGCLNHSPDADLDVNVHRVKVSKPSLLYDIVGRQELWVNSFHHQAVKTLAPGFVITAQAGDEIVEAIERPDYPFLLGVQWHPEGTAHYDEAAKKLFAALIKAAAG
ncbi:MAG: gamma-glutamyl-gamma-aminobutyrate hydrolase family protein [Deltaproteobacteria bacterium]|nr:gamma-glutamyl-gamma-aminobutyrate hydrolase family protein [Deltaproteobacteria bacterium]